MWKKTLLSIEKNYVLFIVIYFIISMIFVFCIEDVAFSKNGFVMSLFSTIGDKSAARGLFVFTFSAVLSCIKIKEGKIIIIKDRSTPGIK